jgi:phosphoribosyl 1,2-cyclic phosphate phosphodiesterase
VRQRFDYAFGNGSAGSTRPALELIEIQSRLPFQINSLEVIPFDVMHGTWMITGFRVGRLGYVTDASAIPPASLEYLYGLDVLVLNALRQTAHPTHFTVEEACALIEQLHPRRALLVHMTHDLDHDATNVALPDYIRLAYDGQVVEVDDSGF